MLAGLLTSAQNPKVRRLSKLKDRRERDETGSFLIEGYREVSRALKGGVELESLFMSPDLFLGVNERALMKAIKAPIFELPKHLFERISYRDRPDGLIAIAKQMQRKLTDLKGSFFVVAEAIEKPGNLGTILRSADGAGVNGVIVCDRCTDIYNPNVVRASVGTLFTVPVVEASSLEAIAWLKEHQITLVAATPSAELLYTQAPLSQPIAIAVGTEQVGLTKTWMDAAEIHVRIPMHGIADSLNVATATTLLLYEAERQRHLHR